jgi:phosphoribosylformylglycinamidine cyclo-ligase
VDTGRWRRPEVFDLIAHRGVPEDEMRRTFNLGIGFCLVIDPDSEGDVMEAVSLHDPETIGIVASGDGVVLR